MNSLKVLDIPYIKDSNQTGIFICFIGNPQSADCNRLKSQLTEDPNLFAKYSRVQQTQETGITCAAMRR